MPRDVARRADGANTGGNLPLAIDEVEAFRLSDRHEIVREVAARRPLVRVRGELVLAALHDIAGLWKRGADFAARRTQGVAAGVVEVQMGIDDECNVLGAHAEVEQPVLERRGSALTAILDTVDVVELLVLLVPRAGIDEHGADLV